MASATTTAASVSITNLPTETLCAIFEDFVFDQMVCMKNHPVIVMEQVCVRWRTIASNTPRLWCHIRSHFPLSLITRMLRMSQAIPLRVDIDFSEYIEAPKTTVATILEHLPTRIHDLRIHTEDWFDLELCWHFLEKPAPFLVNLHMSMDEGYCRYYPWLSMGFLGGVHGSSTNAFKLSIEGIVMRWDSLVPQNLTTLTLKYSCSNGDHDITQSNVIELLRQCPNLEYLTLKILFLRLNSFRDSIIPLPHLRTVSLHITNTSAFNAIMSILDLPLDVHFTLLLPSESVFTQAALFSPPFPRHIASGSLCHSLTCFFGYARVKVEAVIHPNPESRNSTQLLILLGPSDIEDDVDWLCATSKDDSGYHLGLAIEYLNLLITLRPCLRSTSSLEISFNNGLGFFKRDLTEDILYLLDGMSNVESLSVSLVDAVVRSFFRAAQVMICKLSLLRKFRIEMDLRDDNLQELFNLFTVRSMWRLAELRVVGEALPTEKRLKLAAFADVVIFEERPEVLEVV